MPKIKNSPLSRLASCASNHSHRSSPSRQFQFENLEERCVLSANGLELVPEVPTADTVLSTTENVVPTAGNAITDQVQTDITSVTIRINGELQTFDPANGQLELAVGDQFEVTAITFDSNATAGVFAVEGYVNKLDNDSSASLIDYNDGRFSQIEDNFVANGGNGVVHGLSGTWTAEIGWDRLTLSLLHYQEANTTIAARAIINVQVGQADFAFDPESIKQIQERTGTVGEQFDLFGAWQNLGAGKFHNYAEVDIYHSSNRDEIVWAGVIVGNASAENPVEGQFVNTRPNDEFPEFFTPEKSGSYILRFYLDPEGVVAESNEANNQIDIEVFVEESNSTPTAVNDSVAANANETLERIDVLVNDLDSDQDDLEIADFSQPKNGTVDLNEDGTFNYTPDDGFVGVDEFTYSATDGIDESNDATVEIEVASRFEVQPVAVGDEDTEIPIRVELDTEQFTHVRVSNVPNEAGLSHGQVVSPGNFDVDVDDLSDLKFIPAANSDADVELIITPISGSTAFVNLSETVSVSVNAVADGGRVAVADFGIVTGKSGRLPYSFDFVDLDGSERHTLTFDGLPDFVFLSAGEKVGDSWVVGYDDLTDLSIGADRVDDLSGFTRRFQFHFRRFEVKVTLNSIEISNGDQFQAFDNFNFYAIQT